MFSKRSRVFYAAVAVALAVLSAFCCIPKSDSYSEAAKGNAYICMSVDTGEVFDKKDEKLRLPMASTTKIMTAIVVLENCLTDEAVVVTKDTTGVEGSSVYLKEGDVLTVKELLYGLMLRSGNDAAETLAKYCAGSVERFVDMMNAKAEELSLSDTHFVNPHGLHHKEHFTSAYDLAKIACYGMKNDRFREIVSTKFVSVGTGENKRYWSNKNKILSTFPGGNGIKTGYTKDAGRCLVASATREGKTFVSVVLNRYDMFNDCAMLLERAFAVAG